jgi:hypothetical protein
MESKVTILEYSPFLLEGIYENPLQSRRIQ